MNKHKQCVWVVVVVGVEPEGKIGKRRINEEEAAECITKYNFNLLLPA